MSLLEVVSIYKSFGGVRALVNVSFKVNKGEIIGIIGPNGSGKTTLFNIISGFYKPDKGKVILDGKDITGLPPFKVSRMGIARTFQIPKPFIDMTVLENVAVAALSMERDLKSSYIIAGDILKQVNLYHKSQALAGSLTILEKKRLELARAIALNPKILLLDEVLAGLKSVEINEILPFIKKLNENGITILLVEHIIAAITTMCDRVIVLNYGEKIAEGSVNEVLRSASVIKAYIGEEILA